MGLLERLAPETSPGMAAEIIGSTPTLSKKLETKQRESGGRGGAT